MSEIRLKPAEAKKLLTQYSIDPKSAQVAGWKDNTVVVTGSISLTEEHKLLPPGLVVEGDIDAKNSGVTHYKNLKCYGSMDLEGNKHVCSIEKTAQVLGSDIRALENPTADDRRHITNSRTHGSSAVGHLLMNNIPHKLQNFEPNVTSFVSVAGLKAEKFDCSGVVDAESRSKAEYHLSSGRIRDTRHQSRGRLDAIPGTIGYSSGSRGFEGRV